MTITNPAKCAGVYLAYLRTAIHDEDNGIKSHHVDMMDEYIETLGWCGVEVEIRPKMA